MKLVKPAHSGDDRMTDRFLRLTRAFAVAKITSPNVATVVLKNGIVSYGALAFVFTDNGNQFTTMFSTALCAFIGTSLVTTAKYYQQTDGQVKHYNQTLVARLRHYIDDHQ